MGKMLERVARLVDLARESSVIGKCCPVMTLHVRDVFEMPNWGWIKGTLGKLGVLGYLARIINMDDQPKEYLAMYWGPCFGSYILSTKALCTKEGKVDWF